MHGLLLTSGCKPLPDGWCICGMGCGNKNIVFYRDTETATKECNIEVEVLDRIEIPDYAIDGTIEEKRKTSSNNELPEAARARASASPATSPAPRTRGSRE